MQMVIFATGTIGAASHPYGGVRSDGRNTGAVQPITIISSTFTSGTQNEAATGKRACAGRQSNSWSLLGGSSTANIGSPPRSRGSRDSYAAGNTTGDIHGQSASARCAVCHQDNAIRAFVPFARGRIPASSCTRPHRRRLGDTQPLDGSDGGRPRTLLTYAVCTRSHLAVLSERTDEHFSPGREQPEETIAPITYVSLQPCHLDQIHDLLARTFWEGISGTYVVVRASSSILDMKT